MCNELKEKLTAAHAAMGYAINRGVGIREASIALDDAIDSYYAQIHAEMDAQAIESYKTKWNVPVEKENALNANFGALV